MKFASKLVHGNRAGNPENRELLKECYKTRLFLGGRHVIFWRGCAFAEEELLQLLGNYFLIFAARRIQAILIEKHLAVLHPHCPGLLRDVVIHFAAELVVKRRLAQTRQLFLQLHAEYSVSRHEYSLAAR